MQPDGLELGKTAPTVLIRDARGEHVAIQRLRLTTLPHASGPHVAYVATEGRVTLGSHERCDVVIADRTVSRWHCQLAVQGPQVSITDLGSSNGTTVNGVRIERAYVERGSVIGLGQIKLRLDIESDPLRLLVSAARQFGRLVGEAPSIRAVFAMLERAATSDATVLVTGETGTGKELAAHSLHDGSARATRPFVVVDCASIPAELLESELFGHQRGAFTGAIADRAGAFTLADGGTIFLDEIGELPIALQPKLLRVLETREVKPVGAAHYTPIDVRVIAATHRDLPTEIAAGRFRSDLYYRLAVVEVRMPAMRERLEDLPHVVRAMLDELDAPEDEIARMLAQPTLAEMARYPWPGNLRELRNHVERRLTLGDTALLRPTALPPTTGADGVVPDVALPLREAREAWTRELERAYVTRMLDACHGNVSAAARAAGIDRSHFHRLLARYRLPKAT